MKLCKQTLKTKNEVQYRPGLCPWEKKLIQSWWNEIHVGNDDKKFIWIVEILALLYVLTTKSFVVLFKLWLTDIWQIARWYI